MDTFKYEARTKEGAVYRGSMDVATKQDVVDALIREGMLVVKVQEETGFTLAKLNEINIGGIPLKDKVIFLRQLSTMISAGLPLTQALQILYKQADNPRFKKVLDDVYTDVQGGVSLSKAFSKYPDAFDEITVSLIEAGEESGHLEEILERIATETESKKGLQEKVKSAFTYPAIIVVVILVVIGILVTVLVPAMKEIYDDFDSELPWVTQALVDMSDFSVKYWWALLTGFIVSGVATKMYLDTEDGRRQFHLLLLRVPVIGKLMSKIQITQFTRVLALLLKSGLSIVDALDLTARSLSNIHFREAVLEAKTEVEKGVSLAMPISRSEFFPMIVSQMVAVGEESGEIDLVLEKMSDYYNEEVNVMTTNLATLLEPLILIVMGGVIAFVAFAVYMPMFSLVEVIG